MLKTVRKLAAAGVLLLAAAVQTNSASASTTSLEQCFEVAHWCSAMGCTMIIYENYCDANMQCPYKCDCGNTQGNSWCQD